ncbi:hypothetical protein [Nonomuraea aurantiaca]|uniref:hypothetical protein n=1 Tax=Nonomuraea aurantiaca TaxID=2878562 RepID=UPI001CDA5423|nr:hypothetical protein [Nonomuraea aurantiaca]MCA2228930.1 hypothetical protein [Nonomuraea aurantiaca]
MDRPPRRRLPAWSRVGLAAAADRLAAQPPGTGAWWRRELRQEKLKPVAQLPTDAKALKAELLKQYPADADNQEGWLWTAGRWLLLDAPSTPGTRAAVYRMLAGLPHVKVADGVKDDEGRAGVALLLGDPLQQQIIIDRDSGDLLAVQSELLRPDGKEAWLPVGRPFESLLVERLGWTDEQPTEKVERRPGSP